jgi:hypothetical protein
MTLQLANSSGIGSRRESMSRAVCLHPDAIVSWQLQATGNSMPSALAVLWLITTLS